MSYKRGSVCAMYGCTNYKQQKNGNRSFYRMPKDLDRLKLWISASKRQDFDSVLKSKGSDYFYKTYVVCSDHFEVECFRNRNLYSQGLVPGSVPTRNVFKETNPSKITAHVASSIIKTEDYEEITFEEESINFNAGSNDVHRIELTFERIKDEESINTNTRPNDVENLKTHLKIEKEEIDCLHPIELAFEPIKEESINSKNEPNDVKNLKKHLPIAKQEIDCLQQMKLTFEQIKDKESINWITRPNFENLGNNLQIAKKEIDCLQQMELTFEPDKEELINSNTGSNDAENFTNDLQIAIKKIDRLLQKNLKLSEQVKSRNTQIVKLKKKIDFCVKKLLRTEKIVRNCASDSKQIEVCQITGL